MTDDLAQRIRSEIKTIEAEMKQQRTALKTCTLMQKWDLEVAVRALRVRLEELERNLQRCG
jgi:hypothetical protein